MASMMSSMPTSFLAEPPLSLKACTQHALNLSLDAGLEESYDQRVDVAAPQVASIKLHHLSKDKR